MKSQIKICFFFFLIFTQTSFGQNGLFTGFSFSFPNMSGFENTVKTLSMLAGGVLLCAGNEIHVTYNYTPPAFIWDKNANEHLKGGQGFNIEQQHDFRIKNRIFWGFQRNHYKVQSVADNLTKQIDFYYFGYMRELKSENKWHWKPYMGGNFLIYDGRRPSFGLIIGSKLPLSKFCHLENRITIGQKNMNAQLGLTLRYKKSKN